MSLVIDDPRRVSRQLIRDSVEPELWTRNERFTEKLADLIKSHRLYDHPVLAAFSRKEFSLASMVVVHMEVRVAFGQLFTDALIRLMQTATSLEDRLGARARLAARFLVQLNVMEELGYVPTPPGAEGFAGHPGKAHYWQLVDTLAALGAPEWTWKDYAAAPESLAVRETLTSNMHDHLRLAVVLAGIETAFIPYYGPWAVNTLAVSPVDISAGYHSIHVEDEAGAAVDDDHSEDSWYVVRQAATPDRFDETEKLLAHVLDVWAAFIDMLVRKDKQLRAA